MHLRPQNPRGVRWLDEEHQEDQNLPQSNMLKMIWNELHNHRNCHIVLIIELNCTSNRRLLISPKNTNNGNRIGIDGKSLL